MAGSPHRKTQKPAFLQFYPTLRCNMACPFCFNRGLAGEADTDPDDFRKIVAIAADQGIGHIDFLGGEPTLHPDIESMVGMIASAGRMSTMSSNGTRPEILERLSCCFPETSLRIGISLNTGDNTRAHAGSIDKRLRKYIETYRPIVKTLFSNDPKSRGKDLFAGLDIDGLDFRLIYRDAVQETDLGECGSFIEFYNRLRRIQSDLPNVKGVYCQGFLPDRDDPMPDTARCPAGTTKLAVMPDGTVYPCYLLFRYPRFRLGNLLTDDFRSIWEHPMLDFFRYFDQNRCPRTDCVLFDRCHGGCPAQSLMFTGNLDGADPRCCGSPSAYGDNM